MEEAYKAPCSALQLTPSDSAPMRQSGGKLTYRTMPPPEREPRHLTPIEVALVRELAQDWIEAEPGRNMAALAKASELSAQTIGDVLGKRKPPGRDAARAMMGAIGVPWDEFKAQAQEREAKAPPVVTPPSVTVEYPERYPNRMVAIHMAKAAGADPAALQMLGTMTLNARKDPPLHWWLARLEHFEAVARMEREDPQAADASDYNNERTLDRYADKGRPAPETPAKGSRKPTE